MGREEVKKGTPRPPRVKAGPSKELASCQRKAQQTGRSWLNKCFHFGIWRQADPGGPPTARAAATLYFFFSLGPGAAVSGPRLKGEGLPSWEPLLAVANASISFPRGLRGTLGSRGPSREIPVAHLLLSCPRY